MDEAVCLSLDGQAGDQFAWSLLCHVMLGRNERRDLGKASPPKPTTSGE
jgi:hypothetical protein